MDEPTMDEPVRHTSLSPAEAGLLLTRAGVEPTNASPLHGFATDPTGADEASMGARGLWADEWRAAIETVARPDRELRAVIPGATQTVVSTYWGRSSDASGGLVHCTTEADHAHVSFPWSAEAITGIAAAVLLDPPPQPSADLDLRLDGTGITALVASLDVVRAAMFTSLLEHRLLDEMSFTTDNLVEALGVGLETGDTRWLVGLFAVLVPPFASLDLQGLEAGLGALGDAGLVTRRDGAWHAAEPLVRLASWWRNPLPAIAHENVDVRAGEIVRYAYRITVKGDGPLVTFDYGADRSGRPVAHVSAPSALTAMAGLTRMLQPAAAPRS